MKKNLYENTKIYCTCKEKFENKCLEDEKYCIIRDHCHYAVKYRGAVHSCAQRMNDYYLIIKELEEGFKKNSLPVQEKTLENT